MGRTMGGIRVVAVWAVGALSAFLSNGARAQSPCPPGAPSCPPAGQPIVVELSRPNVSVYEVTSDDEKDSSKHKHGFLGKGKKKPHDSRAYSSTAYAATVLVPAASTTPGTPEPRSERFGLMRAAFELKYQEAVAAAMRQAELEERRAALRYLEEIQKDLAAGASGLAGDRQLQELNARITKLEILILEHHKFLQELHREKLPPTP